MNSNRIRFVVAALTVAVVALTLASPASAFVRLTRQGTTGIVQAHWYDSELPLLSVVNPANNDQPSATALAAVVASAKAWENVNTSYFTVNPVDWTTGPYLMPSLSTTDGQNSMFFDMTGANFAPGSGVIAFVRSIVSLTDGHTLDADLVFNDKEFYASVTDPVTLPPPAGQTTVDLYSVITHEYGHYFSLDHTSVSNATMIPYILTNSTIQRTLELDDQAGVSAVYPESAARGLSPGGVDFYATRGTITGTVVSGYNGSAIFGAHVEAWNLAAPTAENSISAISGELTVRNGQGDFKIHGLPPGNYAVRIVPLDGVNTIASDANVGGIFNGLDINFEPEWWNAANESGNGFNDPPTQYAPVTVNAGMDAGGIGFITNTYPGQVEIAQYGATENVVTDRSNAYRAVRFDPPFDPPYTITKIVFPTYTFTGLPGTMPSVMLVPMAANGTPNLAAPLFTAAPFTCSANGNNTVPINLTVTQPNQTFFWVMRWGTRPAPPYAGHPFILMDFTSMERGYWANSYFTASLTGGWSLGSDRNLPVSMFCQMGSPEMAPIQASSNLGTNRRVTKTEFRYTNPADVRADGLPMAQNSLLQVDLLRRPAFGAWTYQASGGAGSGMISQDSIPSGLWVWTTQAVDKYGHKAVQSSMTLTGLNEDANEPNGRLNEATPITPPVASKPATYAPAGDQDYYSFYAKVGDIIDASATATGQDGYNDLDLVMFLFDNSGEIVAYNDDTNGLNPRVVYAVPPINSKSNTQAPRRFTILVTDFRGSFFNPTGAPRLVVPENYVYTVNVTSPVNAAARFSRGLNADGYGFSLGGPNPANPVSKLLYVLPRAADGTRVTLRVYDVQGRMVRTLVDRNEAAGPHTVVWNGTDESGRRVSSGTYFARIEAGTFRQEARVVFVK